MRQNAFVGQLTAIPTPQTRLLAKFGEGNREQRASDGKEMEGEGKRKKGK